MDRQRCRTRAKGAPLSAGLNPNDLWCTDYTGEFQLGNKRCCYLLTLTINASRYLLLGGAMDSNREQPAFLAFERLFRERGLSNLFVQTRPPAATGNTHHLYGVG